MAPEVVRGERYGRKADIWSVGATVVEMLTGKHPWPATEHHFATFTQIATAKGGPPVPATVSRELKDFLNLCFARWAWQAVSVLAETACTWCACKPHAVARAMEDAARQPAQHAWHAFAANAGSGGHFLEAAYSISQHQAACALGI